MVTHSIKVEGIGKVYQLAHQSTLHTSFREALTSAALAPLRRFRQLRGTDASMEDFWALRDISFDVSTGRSRRHHRPQRRRQEHAAQDPLAASPSRPTGRARSARTRRDPARGRHRLSSRADRPREHLPERRDPRHDARARSRASSTRSSPSPRSRSSSTRRSSATRAACTCGSRSRSRRTSSPRS